MDSATPKYTLESVLHYFNLQLTGRTRAEKHEANKFIVAFQQSEEAWQVAVQLLGLQQASSVQSVASIHLVGAQILYTKLTSSFDSELVKKNSNVEDLRNRLFELIKLQKENGQPVFTKPALKKISMCIAIIALKTTKSCWENSIDDLIKFGSSFTPQECYISLLILKNAAYLFSEVNFLPRDQALMRAWFRANAFKVFEFIAQVLSSSGSMPQEVYFEAMKVIKFWCEFSKKTFIIHEPLIEKLLSMLGDSSMQVFKRVCKILVRLLQSNDSAKVLCNSKLSIALSPTSIPERDLKFLRYLVDLMYKEKERYEIATRDYFRSFDDENEEHQSKGMFADSFTLLLTSLVQNYEVLLLTKENLAYGDKIYELLLIGVKAKNLEIARQIIDSVSEFRETLVDAVKQAEDNGGAPYAEVLKCLDQDANFCQRILQMSEIMIGQSQRLVQPHPEFPHLMVELSEEDQEEERQISQACFRQTLEDVFSQNYYLLRQTYSEAGSQKFLTTIGTALGTADALQSEACMFVLMSLEIHLKDDGFQSSIDFVQQVFTMIADPTSKLNSLICNSENVITRKGFLRLTCEMSSFFTKFPVELLNAVLKMVLSSQASIAIQKQIGEEATIEGFYTDAVAEMCLHLAPKFRMEEFLLLKQHLQDNANALKDNHLMSLTESICYVCTKQTNVETIKNSIQEISQIPVGFMDQIDLNSIATVDKTNLMKVVAMLNGVVKAFLETDIEILRVTLQPMIEVVWNKLLAIVQTRPNEPDIILATSRLIQNVNQILGRSICNHQFIETLGSTLLGCFTTNPKNYACLQTVSHMATKLKRINTETDAKLAEVLVACLKPLVAEPFNRSSDVDFLQSMNFMCQTLGDINMSALLGSEVFLSSLEIMVQALETIDQDDLNLQFARFLTSLMTTMSNKFDKQTDAAKQMFTNNLVHLIRCFFLLVSKKNPQKELGMMATSMQGVIEWSEHRQLEEQLRQSYGSAYTSSSTLQRVIHPKLFTTIVGLLFNLRRHHRQMRVCLLNLHSYIQKGEYELAKDKSKVEGANLFIDLELFAAQALKRMQEPPSSEVKHVIID